MIILLIYLKLELATPNEFAQSQSTTIFDKISDIGRYTLILKNFCAQMFYFGDGKIGMPVVVVAYSIFAGFARWNKSVPLIAGVIGLMFMGYSAVYLITPYDLQWTLDTSLRRLLVQQWPSFLFVFALVVKPIDQLIPSSVAPLISLASAKTPSS
jgi:hypothetical protein